MAIMLILALVKKNIRPLWILLAVILAVAGVVVFFLTEDMSLPMQWIDIWTIVNAVILLAEIIAVRLVFKGDKDDDDDNRRRAEVR